jgi:DNA repair exonuclease SbcCD nuclease subunit
MHLLAALNACVIPAYAAGDFWDRRGDLPVVPLNKVQQELSSWQVPLLLLPGNHDQVGAWSQILHCIV